MPGMAAPLIMLKTVSGSTFLYMGCVSVCHDTLRLTEHWQEPPPSHGPSQLLCTVERPSCKDAIDVLPAKAACMAMT